MSDLFIAAFAVLRPLLPWLTALGVVLALITLVVLPVLIIRMPADYFLATHRQRRRGVTFTWMLIVRNGLALLLLLAGIAMLLLPGQGIVTILAAIAVSDVPGKYRLERWFVSRPGVLRSINWVRRKYHKAPVKAPCGNVRGRAPGLK